MAIGKAFAMAERFKLELVGDTAQAGGSTDAGLMDGGWGEPTDLLSFQAA